MYTLHYNKKCRDCERQAKITRSLDWLNRFDMSTEIPPTGELDLGEIAVVDRQKGRVYTGGYATRIICLNVPAYYILGLLMFLPPIFRLIAKSKVGCNGESCRL